MAWYGAICIITSVANISPECGALGKEKILPFPKPPKDRILNNGKVDWGKKQTELSL